MNKKQKTTINSVNDYDRCFQCAATVALNCEKKPPQMISKVKAFQRNITVKEYETHQEKKNNPTVALNVFYIKEINT